MPLRYSRTKFETKEGKELVKILTEDYKKGKLTLQADYKAGKVIVYFKAEHSLFPSSVEINILTEKQIIKDKSKKNL